MKLLWSAVLIGAAFAATAHARSTVTSIAPSSNTTPGVWFESTVTSSGVAALADLTGAGGDLETNAPLPIGAVRLTTTTDNNDRANIGVLDAYGRPDDIFSTLVINYSWHKASNGSQNLAAAPALKLAFLGQSGCVGDCFGQLIYEPTWNGPGSTPGTPLGSNPALDTWTSVTIDENNGLFWWTGGFGQPSGVGGPPINTLAGWRSVLSADFGTADMILVEVGVGSYNQNQLGYFDDVTIDHSFGGGYSAAYDFEPPPPEFTSANVAVGTAPCDVILKDLSGDGIPDIATADSGSDSVTVLTNDGDGAFPGSTTVPLAVGDAPAGLDAGELIVGGGCDLAVAATGNDAIVIVDNAPAGTFAVSATLSTLPATEPVSVAVGDIDGIAPDDFVAAMQGDLLFTGNGSVGVSLNGGAITPLAPPVGGFLRPQRAVLCDLDGDGDNDAVVTMAGTAFAPTVTNNVLLYENTGGVFGAPVTLSVAQNPKGICCADLDDDGDADLAVTAESFPLILPGTVELFLNGGLTAGGWTALAFTSGGSFSGGTSPADLACDDLRDDAIPGFCALQDVVAINFGSENLTRFDGYDAGSTSFGGQSTEVGDLVPVAVAIAGLDGDKTPDIVIANKASDNVTVLLAVTPTHAKEFGTGCVGSAGTPMIEAVGLPTFGNPAFGVKVTGARGFAPTLLGLSLNQATTPLGGGCDLYLQPPLVLLNTVTSGAGEATVFLPIPNSSSSFAGCDAFFQYFIFDPNGAYNGQFAFSDGLRIKVGN